MRLSSDIHECVEWPNLASKMHVCIPNLCSYATGAKVFFRLCKIILDCH